MAQQTTTNKPLTEDRILAHDNGEVYAKLKQAEPSLDWFGFASDIYKVSHSVITILTYLAGTWAFVEFLTTSKKYGVSISEFIAKCNDNEDLVYKALNDFTTFCDSVKGWRGSTIQTRTNGARAALRYMGIKIHSDDFRSKVKMPRAFSLHEEYPPNDVLRKILDGAATMATRAFILVMTDAGLEPVDVTQLKPKYFKFDEDPVRITFKREKTGEIVETFVNNQTAELVKLVIAGRVDRKYCKPKSPDDYIFVRKLGPKSVKSIRLRYNNAIKYAGLHTEKIDDHVYGKYHMKILKKRWFSIAITVAPEYIAQGMLGRKKYLSQYNAQPLQVKQDFARKILKAVDIYANKVDKDEMKRQAASVLGVENMTDEQMQKLRGIMAAFANLPADKLDQITRILQTQTQQETPDPRVTTHIIPKQPKGGDT